MTALKVSLLMGITICFSFATINYSIAQTSIEVSGEIVTDTTWSADIVKVTGDITVINDKTLTIEPGTIIEFQGYYEFIILGSVLAVGKPNDTMHFTINDTTGFYTNLDDFIGCWKGIYFSGKDASKFYCCKFSYAKNLGEQTSSWGGALEIRVANPMVWACHFEHNYTKYYGAAICARVSDGLLIDSCLFNNNIAMNEGGESISNQGMLSSGTTSFIITAPCMEGPWVSAINPMSG